MARTQPVINDAPWTGRTEEFLGAESEGELPAHAGSLPPSDLSENFRHSGWKPFRRKVDTALTTTPGISQRRIAAFRYCGCDAYVESRTLGHGATHTEYRMRSTKCHDRFCVPCSNERSMRIRDSLLRHMHKRPDMGLITLTLQRSTADLTTILNRITRAFRILRNKPLWKANVKGGASIIETKLGTDGISWHVHYHILAEHRFIDQKKLSALWLQITGDSYIVDLRRVGAMSGAVQYITKYVTKAADSSIVNSPKHLSEAIIAFTGRRLVATFGTWRGLQLMEKPNDDASTSTTASPWRCEGSLDAIIRAAVAGRPDALKIVKYLAPRRFDPHTPDKAAPPRL